MTKAHTPVANRDRLELTAGEIPMFLGLASSERNNYQWVDWNVVFEFDSEKSAKSGNLQESIDYVLSLIHISEPTRPY